LIKAVSTPNPNVTTYPNQPKPKDGKVRFLVAILKSESVPSLYGGYLSDPSFSPTTPRSLTKIDF